MENEETFDLEQHNLECDHEHEHGHAHEHVHTHADGTTHSHPHSHEHDHEHGHDHVHTHADGTTHSHSHSHAHGGHHHHHHHENAGEAASGDEKLALLHYMLDHNTGHAEELAGLSVGASEDVETILAQALEHFNSANKLLAEYIQKVEAE